MLQIVEYLRTKGINVELHNKLHKTCCPYPDHPDKDPSFTIYDTDTFYCWGCGKSGNINTLRRLFGDKVIFEPKEQKDLTKEALMHSLKTTKKKRDIYSIVTRIRSMRKWYPNQERLNKRLMHFLNATLDR